MACHSHDVQVLIVSRLEGVCTAISELIEALPNARVADAAGNGRMAMAKMKTRRFDLVLLDLDACGSDPVGLLSSIRSAHPRVGVVALSNGHEAGAVLSALEAGAMDALPRLISEDPVQQKDLRLRLLTVTGLLHTRKMVRLAACGSASPPARKLPKGQDAARSPASQTVAGCPVPEPRAPVRGDIDIIAIAASTGGPNALMQLIPALPANLGTPVMIVQHMPSFLTGSLAASLNARSVLNVREAAANMLVEPNRVYLAPGGQHMVVLRDAQASNHVRRRSIGLNQDLPENSVRPSADILFRSLAQAYDGAILAVILTGMGTDGLKGVQTMKQKACYCLCQSRESCVVYGMPRAVTEAGLSDEQIPLEKIAGRIVEIVRGKWERACR